MTPLKGFEPPKGAVSHRLRNTGPAPWWLSMYVPLWSYNPRVGNGCCLPFTFKLPTTLITQFSANTLLGRWPILTLGSEDICSYIIHWLTVCSSTWTLFLFLSPSWTSKWALVPFGSFLYMCSGGSTHPWAGRAKCGRETGADVHIQSLAGMV